MKTKIKEMFDDIAENYDLLNTILSFGLHKIWKKRIVRLIDKKQNINILDIASGTGDIAILLKSKFGEKADIIGLDFSKKMIEIAKEKASAQNLHIEFIVGDARNLPFPDEYFDYITIAFGIRNVPEIGKCLNEIARVLKNNGILIILEFGKPSKPFYYFYKLYNKVIIPLMGLILTKNIKAYLYLAETSINYPSGQDFLDILSNSGKFIPLKFRPQCFGVAYLYEAKLRRLAALSFGGKRK